MPVPLFLLMGEILFRAGLAARLMDVLDAWLGRDTGPAQPDGGGRRHAVRDPGRLRRRDHRAARPHPRAGHGEARLQAANDPRPGDGFRRARGDVAAICAGRHPRRHREPLGRRVPACHHRARPDDGGVLCDLRRGAMHVATGHRASLQRRTETASEAEAPRHRGLCVSARHHHLRRHRPDLSRHRHADRIRGPRRAVGPDHGQALRQARLADAASNAWCRRCAPQS